jgi:hypothetical protein
LELGRLTFRPDGRPAYWVESAPVLARPVLCFHWSGASDADLFDTFFSTILPFSRIFIDNAP